MGGFGWLADDYARTRGGNVRTAALGALLERYLPKQGRLLDVGAGPGAVSGELDNGHRTIVTLDVSHDMTRQSPRTFAQQPLVADAAALPFPTMSFDVVMLVWVVNHFENVRVSVREAARVAGSAGQIIYVSGVPNHPEWDSSGKILSRLDILRRKADVEERVLEEEFTRADMSFARQDWYVASFRQRPHGLADRIEARLYGHLRGVDKRKWNDVVAPVVADLRSLAEPGVYLRRENRHRLLVFQRGESRYEP